MFRKGKKMIYGHEFQKSYFKKVIENRKLGLSYIFEGKEGIGKKLFALYLAKYFFCENKKYLEDCECKSCQSAIKLTHPYILFLNEDQLKIDVIRGLNEFIYLGGGQIKFIIVDSIHKITKEAAAAFLKTLEESPDGVIFILLTNNYSSILPTIRSRCHRIPFNRLKADEVRSFLITKDQEDYVNCHFTIDSVSELYKSKELFELKNILKSDLKYISGVISKMNGKDEIKNFLYTVIFHLKLKNTKLLDLQIIEIFDFLYLLIKRLDENINIEIVKSLAIVLMSEVINGEL
jgi:DNA polymerase-3 subunit delta'